MSRILSIFFSFILFFSFTLSVVQAQEEGDFSRICEEGESVDQCAVQKLNYGMQPEEQATETEDVDVFTWLSSIGQIVDGIFAYFTGAENLKEAFIPDLTDPIQSDGTDATKEDLTEKNTNILNSTLAGPDGYYGMTLPAELPEGYIKPEGKGIDIEGKNIPLYSDIDETAQLYEQASFPEEYCDGSGNCTKVCPVAGQCNK